MVMTCECFRFMCIINFLLESSNWPHWLQASWLWVVKHVHVHVHRVAKRWEVETIPHNFFSATSPHPRFLIFLQLCMWMAGQYLHGSSGGIDGRSVVTVAACVPGHAQQLEDRSDGP